MSRQETKRKIKQGENGWGCGLLPMTCIPQTHPHLPQLRGGDDGGWEVRKKERWGVSEDRDVQDQSLEGKASSFFPLPCFPQASQVVLVVKNPPANAGFVRDKGSIPGSGRSPGGGHGNPLQYSLLENLVDRGAWRATAHRITKSRTGLKQLGTHACFPQELTLT